ncbi:MAG TPA: ABC transporter permease, partial [Steroidobacteraceae bacterium]|nr:ABC transporter permease [Steroidobacteraceae bacterium]
MLLSAVGLLAVIWLPFVVFKTNRIMPGEPRGLQQVLSDWTALGLQAVLLLTAAVAVGVADARRRLITALAAVIVLALAVAAAANALTPAGNKVVRVAPGAASWLLLICLGLMATDAITRMRPGPLVRVLLLALALAATGAALAAGTFDNLSVMREYAVNASRFPPELWRHVWLAGGSLLAAVLVGLPLGILCHRAPRLQPPLLGTLNVIQTIPAIALFGILMAPLGALAARVPAAAALGIRGIGAAPAVVALFLYSLLPIVANTVVGLRRVSHAAVDAALGVGMTPWQVLRSIELPLALPVIITGIRVVLVQNIGMVTVAALIGGGGLGTFVFQG